MCISYIHNNLGCRGKGISIPIPTPFPRWNSILWEFPIKLIHIWESIGETRIHQKYGKLRNAIIWLPGGCGTWNLYIILITCSSKYIQNFKSFWDGGVFDSVKWYRMPWLHIIIAVSILCSELVRINAPRLLFPRTKFILKYSWKNQKIILWWVLMCLRDSIHIEVAKISVITLQL